MRQFAKIIAMVTVLIYHFLPAKIANAQPIPDTKFVQETHQGYRIGISAAANDLLTIAVDRQNNVWAGGRAGLFRLSAGQRSWQAMFDAEDSGPVFNILCDADGKILVAAWNGLHVFQSGENSSSAVHRSISAIDSPVTAMVQKGGEIIAAGPAGWWRITGKNVRAFSFPCSRAVKDILAAKSGEIFVATGMGLFMKSKTTRKTFFDEHEIISPYLEDLAFAPNGDLWAGGLGGVTVFRNNKTVAKIMAKDGLPSSEVTCVEQSPDGKMWVGTRKGISRFAGGKCSVRHSKRWLLDDDVRDIAFSANGTAWIATRAGVSAIIPRKMTLAEKAKRILEICYARHVRPPYLVGRCNLTIAGDTTSWAPADDDNDGQYTAMYLGMESYRYAVTKNPQAGENARKAFDALKFLQEVTQTPGFFARTVIPADWQHRADPDRELNDRDWAMQLVNNPREKRVHKRWFLSPDKKWLWKATTSSDEMTGHMWGYYIYHELVADAAEKKRVAAHVGKIVNYLIDCGYTLHDVDGKPTKWAVWSPEKLNHDPDWQAERGINSVELLSYLKLAFYMTGDKKFEKHYRRLIEKHNYAHNARFAKNTNPALRTHIDDELLALAFPALIKLEKDQALRKLYLQGVDGWWQAVKVDQSAYFNFVYGDLTGDDPQLGDALFYLRDAPIDQVHWTVDNSRREDVQLTRLPEYEKMQTARLLPPSERGILRWDNNPRQAVQGHDGRSERTGVQWLLPYWMGRYLGYIGG